MAAVAVLAVAVGVLAEAGLLLAGHVEAARGRRQPRRVAVAVILDGEPGADLGARPGKAEGSVSKGQALRPSH